MYPTLEVRWFLPGKLPPQLRDWFNQQTQIVEPESREDWYLYTPKNRTLGIKLRQDELELKQRLANRGVRKLAKQVRGRVEHWVKWSYPLADSAALPDLATGLWIPVNKTRWSRHYSVDDGKISLVESASQFEQGCSFELSQLQIVDQDWYSLCFETFSQGEFSSEVMQPILEKVVQAQAGLPALRGQYSCGYPQWLKRVRQNVM
jgi:hypothetical protein